MIIASFVVFVIGVFYDTAWYILILPLSYSVLNLIFPQSLKCFSDNIINRVYQVVLFIRFVFTPLLFIFSYKYNYYDLHILLEDRILFLSAFMMCIELFFSLLLMQIFLKKKKNILLVENIKSDNKLFFLIVTLFFIYIYFIDSRVSQNINFILTLQEFSSDKVEGNGFSLIFSFILITFPLFFISLVKDSKLKNKFILTLFLLLPFVLFVKGDSRLSLLIPLLSWFSVLVIIYPKYKKHILYGFYVLAGFILMFLTLIKNFSNESNDLDLNSLALYFNAYFSNIYNVGYSIITYQNLDLTHKNLFFNDFFQNIVFLNQFIDRNLTSNTLFNRNIYGHSLWADQIVPVIGQSILYFGLFGAPIISSILTLGTAYFSNKLNSLNKISYIYIYSYMGCYLAVSFNMLNISSVVSNFTNYFLPIIVLIMMSKFRIRVSKK